MSTCVDDNELLSVENEDHEDFNKQGDELHVVDLVPVPSHVLFPSELNEHLKEEIKYLVQENTMLRKNVQDLEVTVKNTEEEFGLYKLKEQHHEFQSNDITRAKIVELSKKLREKSAELSHFKTKCAKLDQSLAVMKQNEAERAELTVHEKPEKPSESELKVLNDKISVLSSKLFEEKNHVLSLKNELKLAVKILQEEVGEPFENIQQLTSNCHWKGRAQIIAELQYKLQECKEKLKIYQEKECGKPNEVAAKKTYQDSKITKLIKENLNLKLDFETITKKYEHGRQKIKNMDIECHNWRMKYSNIADQLDKERSHMNSVTESQTNSHTQLTENLKRREKQIEKLQKDNKEYKSTLKSKEFVIENLQKIIQEKDQIVANKLSVRPNSPNRCLTPKQLDAERLRLLELTKVYSQRLQKERDEKHSFETMYKSERHKAAKLEANLARAKLVDTDRTMNNSYSSLISKPGFEENLQFKLELAQEKIKALQTRLQIEKSEREHDMKEFNEIVRNYQ